MQDLISRQATIDDIKAIYEWHDNVTKERIIEHFKQLPPAQPEIIRCKDCKYWREHKYAKETKRYIPFCGFNAIYTKADDFCSRAERKTDE